MRCYKGKRDIGDCTHWFGFTCTYSISRRIYVPCLIYRYFSMKRRLYFLKRKFEVFNKFKELKYLVETKIEKKIKMLRTDNGGEFYGKYFRKFYKQWEIVLQNKNPHTTQYNGDTERMNRSLMPKRNGVCLVVRTQNINYGWRE